MKSKLILFVTTVLAWYVAAYLVDALYLIPYPHHVLRELVSRPYLYLEAIAFTALEAVGGLLLGVTAALILSLVIFFLPRTEKYVMPYAIGIKSTPVIALAPLLAVWFGPGLFGKIVMSSLISFFPVLQNVTDALKSVPEGARHYVRVLGAPSYRDLKLVRLYFAMPLFASSLKVAAPLAVVGAMVSEFLGADVGVGHLLWISVSRADTKVIFASILSVTLIGWSLYAIASIFELIVLKRLRMEREVYKTSE